MNDDNIPLIKYRNIKLLEPKIGDFIIYHGLFWSKWYGVINTIDKTGIKVVKENLPCLLFNLDISEYDKHTITLSKTKIINSFPGAYHVLQGDVWYI